MLKHIFVYLGEHVISKITQYSLLPCHVHLKERKKQTFTTDGSPPRWGSHCPQEGARESISVPTVVRQECERVHVGTDSPCQKHHGSSAAVVPFLVLNPEIHLSLTLLELKSKSHDWVYESWTSTLDAFLISIHLMFWDGAAYCSLIHRGWWLAGISSTCLLSPSLPSFLYGYTLWGLQ